MVVIGVMSERGGQSGTLTGVSRIARGRQTAYSEVAGQAGKLGSEGQARGSE